MKHISEVMNVKDTIENISVEDARNKLNDPNVQFIDVRDKETYEKGTIGNAINLERGLLEFYLADGSPLQVDEFKEPTDKEYIVLCNLGGQSALATKTIKDMGISNVKNQLSGYTQEDPPFGLYSRYLCVIGNGIFSEQIDHLGAEFPLLVLLPVYRIEPCTHPRPCPHTGSIGSSPCTDESRPIWHTVQRH